jgi:hypothetical protein
MPKRLSSWVFVVLLNAALAGVIAGAAPRQPVLSDRNDYEYNFK